MKKLCEICGGEFINRGWHDENDCPGRPLPEVGNGLPLDVCGKRTFRHFGQRTVCWLPAGHAGHCEDDPGR